MFIVLLYTFYGKLSNAFIFFQDSEKSEGLYEKELNLEPLILYLCRLYDCLRNFYPLTKTIHWIVLAT